MDTRDKLLSVSTATLTTQLFKRGFRNVFIHGLRALNPRRDRVCGPAVHSATAALRVPPVGAMR